MEKRMVGVKREIHKIAKQCNKLLPGVIGVKIVDSVVYACKEDWKYQKTSISAEKLISELKRAGFLGIYEVLCLVDDEGKEDYCLDNNVLQFYEVKIN